MNCKVCLPLSTCVMFDNFSTNYDPSSWNNCGVQSYFRHNHAYWTCRCRACFFVKYSWSRARGFIEIWPGHLYLLTHGYFWGGNPSAYLHHSRVTLWFWKLIYVLVASRWEVGTGSTFRGWHLKVKYDIMNVQFKVFINTF